MNNINLYLDNLVDQGYDITLVMYWYGYYLRNYSYNYEDINEFGSGFIYQYGCGVGYGYWHDQYR